MGISAPKPETVDAGSPWPIGNWWPILRLLKNPQVAVERFDGRAELVEQKIGWDNAVLERKGRFQHPSNTGGALRVSEYRFDGPNVQWLCATVRLVVGAEKNCADSLSFDGVSGSCPCNEIAVNNQSVGKGRWNLH